MISDFSIDLLDSSLQRLAIISLSKVRCFTFAIGEDGDYVYPRLLERGKDEERLCHLHAIESGSDIWTDSWIGSYMGGVGD